MKTLFLLRHAKSSWADPGQSDADRPLNGRGHEAALAMGRELRHLGLAADRILASPALRVTETLAGLAEGYGGRMAVDHDSRLYLAPPATLLDIVHAVDDAVERLMIVGHNPGIAQLALMLDAAGALRDEIAAKYPTGGFAEIRLEAPRWREVGAGGGAIERFIRPRDLEAGAALDA